MRVDPLLVTIALPFGGALVAAFLKSNARNAESYVAGVVALACLIFVIAMYPQVAAGDTIRYRADWIGELGLEFNLRVDGLAWAMAALVTGIGFLVVLYARYYMAPTDPVPRFFSFFLAFMGAMLGIVLSGNLIQLVFFWELTSLFSFLLIGYWHGSAHARDSARQALIVTSVGGFSLFAGVLILGHIVGSYDLDQVLAAGAEIRSDGLYVPALVLILVGALTKSAQFPFFSWLPRAMAAPTPVSAYLHSATLVKAGVFLLVRLWPALGGTNEWLWLVGSAGLATFILGAFVALFQHDLKGLLAYSTISHLGLITLLTGLDTGFGQIAAIFHIVNHAIFKASLFMAAGIIDRETGTRDIRRLTGLWRFMPITSALAIVAAAAMAGVPLLNGFLSKEMFFAETIEIHDNSPIDQALPYVVTLASMFTVAYSLRFIREVFLGPPPVGLPRTPSEPPFLMRLPAELLVLICVLIGVAPGITVGPVLANAVRSVVGESAPQYSLAVWHGFTPELLMSLLAMTGGVILYASLRPYLRSRANLLRRGDWGDQRLFDVTLLALSSRFTRWLERVLGTRRLQPQLQLVAIAAILAASLPLASRGVAVGVPLYRERDIIFAVMWLVGIACAIGAAYQAKFHRLASLILLGGVGLITCLSFVWLSAPDLALTQLAVETVTTVLLLLGLRWLPKRVANLRPPESRLSLRWYRVRDLMIAAGAGVGLATLVLAILTTPAPDAISSFFVERAYTDGGGTNVVNVILVDFRGFDTLGEITVLGVVALTAYALLRRFRPAPDSIPVPEQQRLHELRDKASPRRAEGENAKDAMATQSLVASLLFPVLGATSIFLLMRGHDAPGGGFVAGVVMALAFVLQYLARGGNWVEARLRILPVRWMGAGLLLAVVVGSAAWAFGYPFLTSHFSYVEVPFIGTVPAASALLFDIGVFALVVGATVLMLIALAHQSVRSHRLPRATTRPQVAPTTSTQEAK